MHRDWYERAYSEAIKDARETQKYKAVLARLVRKTKDEQPQE